MSGEVPQTDHHPPPPPEGGNGYLVLACGALAFYRLLIPLRGLLISPPRGVPRERLGLSAEA
eukprot:1410451-Prymnesium_polylepis.1